MLVIAHRGASAVAPENTIASFREAVRAGADLIELDVRFSRDKVPIMFHDRSLQRTSNGTGPAGALSFSELKALDAGSWFSREFAGERIPSLEEVFSFLSPRRIRLFIEIKIDPGEEGIRNELVPAVLNLIAEKGFSRRATLASFDWDCLRLSKERQPALPTGLIFREGKVWGEAASSLYRDIDVLCARFSAVSPEAVEAAHRARRQVYAWTVDKEEELRPMIACGVDAVASNHPAWLIAALKSHHS